MTPLTVAIHRPRPLLAGLLAATTLAFPAAADDWISVDIANDELVSIDAESGAVTTVGPLGVNVENVKLVRYEGQLIMLDAGIGSGSVMLYNVNESTGSATAIAPLSLPGETIEFAEVLFQYGDDLMVAVDATPGNGVRSDRLGQVDVRTGVVEQISQVPSSALSDGGDLDAAIWDGSTDELIVFERGQDAH